MAKYDYGVGCPCGLQYECDCGSDDRPRCQCGSGGHCTCNGKNIRKMKNEENDFGFTFADEQEVQNTQTQKLNKLREMIMPLLNNLKKNPEKDIIKWKGSERVKNIDEFVIKMNKLIDDN